MRFVYKHKNPKVSNTLKTVFYDTPNPDYINGVKYKMIAYLKLFKAIYYVLNYSFTALGVYQTTFFI